MSDTFLGSTILDTITDPIDLSYIVNDKIINAKFIRRDGTFFTIRSDYEMDYDPKGFYRARKCEIKPELMVEYMKVSSNKQIHIKLFVTNLHLMYSEKGGEQFDSFSYSNNPIKTIILQIGYFHQFPDATKMSLEDFYNLTDRRTKKDYEEISCYVLAVYPVSLPPDGVTLFDCVIGTSESPYQPAKEDTVLASKLNAYTSGKPVSVREYLFEVITRRYLRGNVSSRDITADAALSGDVELTFGKNNDTNEKAKIHFDGPLLPDSAEKYGVKCYVTSTVEKMGFVTQDDPPEPMLVVPEPKVCFSAPEALNEITRDLLPKARALFLPSGNVIIFDMLDTADFIKADLAANYAGKMGTDEFPEKRVLPAIYSITYAGLRSIKCPFFSIVKPFQTISFSSEYNLGTRLAYFYSPKPGQELFVVINYTVKFSTTGEENEMELFSTDSTDQKG